MLRDDGFENLGDKPLASGELPANLRDEDLEPLFPQQPSRFLIVGWQRRCDRQEVANEQGESFGCDGHIALDSLGQRAEFIEPARHYVIDAWRQLW